MVTPVYQIVWTKRAQQHLHSIYHFISQDSPQNAKKVVNDIVMAVAKVTSNPEFYPPDKYKKNNTGKHRALEIHHYRIAYRIASYEIVVLRVKHTSMDPKAY